MSRLVVDIGSLKKEENGFVNEVRNDLFFMFFYCLLLLIVIFLRDRVWLEVIIFMMCIE